jgi:hypothetical protein
MKFQAWPIVIMTIFAILTIANAMSYFAHMRSLNSIPLQDIPTQSQQYVIATQQVAHKQQMIFWAYEGGIVAVCAVAYLLVGGRKSGEPS